MKKDTEIWELPARNVGKKINEIERNKLKKLFEYDKESFIPKFDVDEIKARNEFLKIIKKK